MQPRTVGELMQELQRALKRGDLEWDSEVLGPDMTFASLEIKPTRSVANLRVIGHVVIV